MYMLDCEGQQGGGGSYLMSSSRLTPERLAQIEREGGALYQHGFSIREAAGMVGCSREILRRVLVEMNETRGTNALPDYKDNRKPESDIPHLPERRTCLMCGGKFISEWAGNRVCKKCRATAVWSQGA